MKDPGLKYKGMKIPAPMPNETPQYLGINYSPWKGFITTPTTMDLMECVVRVGKLALKPMLKTYIIPYYQHQLSLGKTSNTQLRITR